MKKLKLVGGMLVGVAIGLVLVLLLIYIIDGKDALDNVKDHDIEWATILLSVACAIVSLILSVVIHFALHEVGHMVMGMLTGYKFLSLRLFKYAIIKDKHGRLTFKRFNVAGTGGQCIMDLPHDTDADKMPFFWHYAGGVMANILIVAISIIILKCCDMGIIGTNFFMMMAFAGVLIAISNGVPISQNGLSNDAKSIQQLYKYKSSRTYVLRMMHMTSMLLRGTRLKDMPKEWFEDVMPHDTKDYFKLAYRINYITWLEDCGRFEDAKMVCEQLDGLDKPLPLMLKMEKDGEQVMCEMLTTKRKEVVEPLLTQRLRMYVNANKTFSATKLALAYVVASHYDDDQETAMALLDEFASHRQDYLMPGEIETAENIIEIADKHYKEIANKHFEIDDKH